MRAIHEFYIKFFQVALKKCFQAHCDYHTRIIWFDRCRQIAPIFMIMFSDHAPIKRYNLVYLSWVRALLIRIDVSWLFSCTIFFSLLVATVFCCCHGTFTLTWASSCVHSWDVRDTLKDMKRLCTQYFVYVKKRKIMKYIVSNVFG